VTGDVLTQKAKELALIPELEVSEGFVCSSGWLTNFKKRHGISSQVRHGEAGSAPASSSLRPSSKAAGGVAGQGRREPGECATEDTFNMDESGLYYGQQPSRRWREGGLQEIRRTRSA
jgi:hypothetical protein